MAETIVIIPARLGSTRLPGKPLAEIGGQPMIRRVYERARAARGIATVVVATDDRRIADAVRAAGGQAVLTRADHPSGTDRLAEVARGLGARVIVNVQGDLPFLDPRMVEALAELHATQPDLEMSTLCAPITDPTEFASPHVVKVVTDSHGFALYFSRAPIPHSRDGHARPGVVLGRRHVGIYAYRRDVLLALSTLPPSPLERREGLEQLRALERGVRIRVVAWPEAAGIVEVDTRADLERARAIARASGGAGAAAKRS